MTFQGEITLRLLPRMEKGQILEGELVFGFLYLIFLDPAVFCRSGLFREGKVASMEQNCGRFLCTWKD